MLLNGILNTAKIWIVLKIELRLLLFLNSSKIKKFDIRPKQSFTNIGYRYFSLSILVISIFLILIFLIPNIDILIKYRHPYPKVLQLPYKILLQSV